MIRITPEAWNVMVAHGRACFPKECCGILVGSDKDGTRDVSVAVACRNAYQGDQKDRFELDVKDILAAERQARERSLSVVGFFHSHPDEDAYFSSTDLKNSAPGYSNVVMSIRGGEFSHAKAFIANFDQTHAEPEELHYG